MVDDFVGKVNSAVRHQEEVEKIRSVLGRLATTAVVHDVPSGWEKVFNSSFQSSHHIIVTIAVLGAIFTYKFIGSDTRSKHTAFENSDYGGSFSL